MADEAKPSEPILIDITKLSAADLDKIDAGNLKAALKAVIRPAEERASRMMHRDHNSHSNT